MSEHEPLKTKKILELRELPPAQPWPPLPGAQLMANEVKELVNWSQNTLEQLRNANGCVVQFTFRCRLMEDYVRKLLEEQQPHSYSRELREATTWAAETVDRTLKETIQHLQQVRTDYIPLLAALPVAADEAEQDYVLGRFLIDEES